jgi:hypothetical protein
MRKISCDLLEHVSPPSGAFLCGVHRFLKDRSRLGDARGNDGPRREIERFDDDSELIGGLGQPSDRLGKDRVGTGAGRGQVLHGLIELGDFPGEEKQPSGNRVTRISLVSVPV